MRIRWSVCFVLLVALTGVSTARAQVPLGTGFTYQGRLADVGVPPTGAYDLQFQLFDAAAAGSQVGGTLTLPSVAVTDGLFTVRLDFGAAAFTGSARWLEIGVRPGGSPNPFTILSPRQELTPAPDAIFSTTAPWSGVTGKPAGFADNVDNDSGGDITSVSAGAGLTGGGSSGDVTLGVNTSTIQSRVTGTCASGSSIRVVNSDGSVACQTDTGPAGQTFFQVSQSSPFTPPNGSGVTLNPSGYTTITGMSVNVTVPASSFLLVTSYGDVAASAGTARADVAVFVDGTFNFTIQPPRSLTAAAGAFTPYAISFGMTLPAGIHNFSLRGQNYAGFTAGVFGQTSPGLLTIAIIKQ